MQPFAVAFGANLGVLEAAFDAALLALDALDGVEVLGVSSLYDSEPWGLGGQPPFLNAAAVGRTRLAPSELLAAMQAIEAAAGPKPEVRNGPRWLDLDLLLHGDARSAGPDLVLPHPRASGRPFVVWPLQEALALAPAVEPPPAWRPLLELDESGREIVDGTTRRPPAGLWPCAATPAEVRVETRSPEATEAIGRALGRAARLGDLFALDGPLGAGKSCLARGIGEGFGVDGPMPSPTFTLCREHPAPRGLLAHWDFYRMESDEDLESSGWEDADAAGSVRVVEWAGRFPHAVRGGVSVRIARGGDGDDRALDFAFPPASLPLRRALAQAIAP